MLLGSLVLLIHKENTCTSKPDLLMEMAYVLILQECFTAQRDIALAYTSFVRSVGLLLWKKQCEWALEHMD